MVIDIALGIVLAVILLGFWPLILAAGVAVLVVGLGLLLLVAAVVNWKLTAGVLGGLVVLGFSFFVPMAGWIGGRALISP